VALIPKLSCPFCRPAYAAIASTLGLGFLVNARYLFAVTAAFLFIALPALSGDNSTTGAKTSALAGGTMRPLASHTDNGQ
jgi:hypothetical protein